MEVKTDLFLSTWNIASRGYVRLYNLLLSLKTQSTPIHRVWVADGSYRRVEAETIAKICDQFPGLAIYASHTQMRMNKPYLINECARNSGADYFIFSDVDYLFSLRLHEQALKYASENTFIFKGVLNLPKMVITSKMIKEWDFPLSRKSSFPDTVACGAFQFHSRAFFEQSGGLDERMEGMSGMDEDYFKRARLAGLTIHNLTEGEILHQWHVPVKRSVPTLQQKQNWAILHNRTSINWRDEY